MFTKMTKAMAAVCAAACIFLFLSPKAAMAQNQGTTYYTYVSQWTVPRAQWEAFAKQDQASQTRMKQAVADGLLIAWGNSETRVHTSEGFTHAEWFTATSRENLLKVLEAEYTTATNPSFVAATRHADLMLHTVAHGGKSGANGTGYLRVASYQAKPGSEEALGSLLTSKVKLFLDEEARKGNITLYNIDEEDIHSDMPGGYDLAMLFPDGGAIDRFYADYAALGKSDPTTGVAFDSITVSKDHRDDFARVTAYQNK